MKTRVILPLILLLTSLSATTNAQINANPDPAKDKVTLCSSRTQDCTI